MKKNMTSVKKKEGEGALIYTKGMESTLPSDVIKIEVKLVLLFLSFCFNYLFFCNVQLLQNSTSKYATSF
jgi:hypothetical protein